MLGKPLGRGKLKGVCPDDAGATLVECLPGGPWGCHPGGGGHGAATTADAPRMAAEANLVNIM